MSKNIGDRILKASVAVFIAHLCFKVVGFVQFFVIGGLVETTTWEAIYGFAFEGVIFSLFFIGEELIGPALLPVFISEKEKHGEKAAWLVGNTLITLQMLILGVVVVLLIVFPEKITNILTYWNKGEHHDLAVQSVRIMAPALIGFSLGSTTYMLLNGYKKFFLAAFGDAVWKGFVLISVFVGIYVMGMNWKALAFGIVVGSVAKLLTHLIGLFKQLSLFRISFNFNNPAFKTVLCLMAPLLIGIIFAKVRDFYNHITVLSSLDTAGLIKANKYGCKLFQAIGTVVPYTLSIAMFPFFCDLIARNDNEKMGKILTKSGRMLMAIFIPIAMVFTLYSHDLVKLLVLGKFSTNDAYLSGISMACYTLVLPAYSLEMLLMQAFFAKRKMISVTVAGILFSSLSIAISYIGIMEFGFQGASALMVVSLGYVVSRTLKSITLLYILKINVPMFPIKESAFFITKLLIIGLLSTAAVWSVFTGFDYFTADTQSKSILIPKLALAALAAFAAYLVGIIILKVDEPRQIFHWGLDKLKSKTSK